jgi:hypothetical protein
MPTVAFDGVNYLVTYLDSRALPGNGVTVSASRVSPSGKLLDGTATQPGIVVTSDPTLGALRVRAAFLGGHYRLIWQQSSSAGTSLFGASVSTDGMLVSPGANGFVLNDSVGNGMQLIGTNASSGFIVWGTKGSPLVAGIGISFRTIFP